MTVGCSSLCSRSRPIGFGGHWSCAYRQDQDIADLLSEMFTKEPRLRAEWVLLSLTILAVYCLNSISEKFRLR